MKYGLPYKGSKNKLATRIVDILPQRANLYDLFCGGCAITHAAMMGNKFQTFHINDINWMCPTLFKDVLNGKYDHENRWISRDDFFRLKDTDPYVAFVWSFGNNLRTYIYGKQIEPLKKSIHYAMFYADYSLAAELGHDLSFIDGIEDMQQRYLAIKHYFEKYGHFQMQSVEGGQTQRLETYERSTRYGGGAEAAPILRSNHTPTSDQPKCRISKHGISASGFQKKNISAAHSGATDLGTAAFRLQYRERHHSLPQGGGQFNLVTSHGDYQQVVILPDSVIYCDIPYRNTDVYDKKNQFDYERFYDWACKQTEPVFISEYWMPEDRFECIQEFVHRSTLSSTANNAVVEKLFIPKGQLIK